MPYDVEIPAEIDGKPVRQISERAFFRNQRIRSITIPDGLQIGPQAFYECPHLESVHLPEGLTAIESQTFTGCPVLEEVNIPSTVETIGSNAFASCCALKQITLPAGLKQLDEYAFFHCTALEPVTLPQWFKGNPLFFGRYQTEYVEYTFSNKINGTENFGEFPKLTEMVLPENVTEIDTRAYAKAHSLKRITILNPDCKILWKYGDADETLTICGLAGSTAEAYAEETGKTFLPLTANTLLPQLRFSPQDCSNCYTYLEKNGNIVITSIQDASPYPDKLIIPEMIQGKPVQSILPDYKTGDNYRTLSIPKTVINIDVTGFKYSDNLEAFEVDPNNPAYSSEDGVLFNKDKTALLMFPPAKKLNTYQIPATVKRIANEAFSNNKYLGFVTAPAGLEKVDWGAFHTAERMIMLDFSACTNTVFDSSSLEKCSSLEVLLLPKNITDIPYGLCDGCEKLREIVIPDSVTKIGTNAFRNCKALKKVQLSNNLTDLGSSAFANCESLGEITLPKTLKVIENDTFHNNSNLKSVTVLNPKTRISNDSGTISNRREKDAAQNRNVDVYDGVIRGYTNSPAEEYANTYHYRFESIGVIEPETTTTTTVTTTTQTTTTQTTTTQTTTTQTTTTETTTTETTSTTSTTETTTTTTEPAKNILRGDVNLDGTVSIEDAQLALTAYTASMAGLESGLNEDQMTAVDVNLDHQLSIEDAQFILLYYVENSVSGNPTPWDEILK